MPRSPIPGGYASICKRAARWRGWHRAHHNVAHLRRIRACVTKQVPRTSSVPFPPKRVDGGSRTTAPPADVGLGGQLVRVDHLDGDERVPVLEPHSGLGSVHAVDETRDCAFLRVCARAFGALGRRAPGFLGRDQGAASGFAALARLLARALTNPAPVQTTAGALPLCDLEGVALLLCDLEGVVPHPTDARCRRSAREDGARLAAALGVAGGHEDHGPLAAGTAAASTSAPCGRKGCSGASVRVGWVEEDRVTRLQDATLHHVGVGLGDAGCHSPPRRGWPRTLRGRSTS